MMQRRRFLSHMLTGGAAIAFSGPAMAQGKTGALAEAQLRGSLNASQQGILPGAIDNQSRKFQRLFEDAARQRVPVFIPAGTYVLSNIVLPDGLLIQGMPGQTQLVYGGDGHFLSGRDLSSVRLEGLIFDGANRWPANGTDGLLDLRSIEEAVIRDCVIRSAGRDGIYLENTGGAVSGNQITRAGRFGLFSVEGRELTISDNRVSLCGNGGIIVHRWSQGHDSTTITGNRINDVRADDGGTGQWGNGINLFRTDDVIVSGNQISDCAFSAIRANSARSMTIAQNQCRGIGETAIYAEFSFQDAVVSDNLIDGATNGISITNFNEGGRSATVSGNIIRNLSAEGSYVPEAPGFGIGIAVEADTLVTGNVIENAEKMGINAGWGPNLRDVIVSSNVIRNASIGIGVSVAKGAGEALITGNVIHGAQSSIIGHEWTSIVTGDLARSPRGKPGNVIIENNRVT